MRERDVNNPIEKRGFVWRCSNASLINTKYREVRGGDVSPCFKWNSYFGRKWAWQKGDPRWMGKCKAIINGKECGRQRQLNLTNVEPSGANYFTSRKETIANRISRNKKEAEDHKAAVSLLRYRAKRGFD